MPSEPDELESYDLKPPSVGLKQRVVAAARPSFEKADWDWTYVFRNRWLQAVAAMLLVNYAASFIDARLTRLQLGQGSSRDGQLARTSKQNNEAMSLALTSILRERNQLQTYLAKEFP